MTRFDLRGEAPGYHRLVRTLRWVIVTVAIAAAVTAGYLTVEAALSGDLGGLYLAGIVLIWVWVAAFGSLAVVQGPLPDYFEVDEKGVRFGSSGATAWGVDWDSPSFKFVVDQTTGINDTISRGQPSQAAAFGRRGFRGILTPEALEAFTNEADRRGFIRTEQASPRPGWVRAVYTRPNPP